MCLAHAVASFFVHEELRRGHRHIDHMQRSDDVERNVVMLAYGRHLPHTKPQQRHGVGEGEVPLLDGLVDRCSRRRSQRFEEGGLDHGHAEGLDS